MEYEDKFFVWGRKIEDQVLWYKNRDFSDETIRIYLQKCADKREEYLDPDDLTALEEDYTRRIQKYFVEYGVIDPIFENL